MINRKLIESRHPPGLSTLDEAYRPLHLVFKKS